MRIGELAALAGVSTRTVRHYHHIGLLPEPARRENGYRTYALPDAVRLVRARRLVDLGLSLDEVADALADDQGRDLTEVLVELDEDLAAQQARLQHQRDRIAELLATGTTSPAAALPSGHPGQDREKLIAELLPSQTWPTYRKVLADSELSARIQATAARFEALADRPADDPEVEAVAAEARDHGATIFAGLPAELRDAPGDPAAAERLLTAVTAAMSPAQARCLRLMIASWAAP